MADTQIDIPGVGPVAFPDSMSEAQINAAATRLYQNANVGKKQPPVTSWTSPGMDAAAVGRGVPVAADAAMELATNPAVPRAAAAVGRVAGAVAPAGAALAAGNPGEAIALGANAGKTAWAGGGVGWKLGKLAQKAAAPLNAEGLGVAGILQNVAPYAQALSTIGGAQGVNDLAQMAEPKRRDIGVLGVGPSVKTGAIPDTPKLVGMAVEDAVRSLTDAGWPEARAKSYVTQMRKLMAK